MDIATLGGQILGQIPLGDIVLYLTPFNLFMFAGALIFTTLIAISRTETQIEAEFGSLKDKKVKVDLEEFKIRRFLAIVCGLATAGAMITGDLFNFTLFVALIGIVNIGIVSAVKQVDVLNAAYQYGLVAMIASMPLFAGAALILGATGTLSLFQLSQTVTTPMMYFASLLLLMGIIGETGVAPFYATKAEMFRTPGSPFILIIHLSSLLIIIRAIEILLIINKPF
ncbi:MAG: proton-conducting transporter membrane subunit [Methanobacteriaceae archaeon]|nr:proton-conducting transporter membrane subunit [Methanobacteriaceae archaeon]MDP2835360.1 proton-conducting transporter membrane subunit [Methanobacteriaceae archaeon]MDP3035055.1 proton-conducting transporter membrane subunit [Methanobacteriaceae archaeon]MDP3484973.1 proton-conducting transporter membrane subunit [Methanobacteriaceae archaeon]MDP3622486.1 proton-conducting transporter membrane subunit [Methanobacteriaceae archaeon]